MPGTLFFVHGTGVRHDGYMRTLDLIRDGTGRVGLDVTHIKGMSWGNELGVKLDRLLDALPEGVSTKAVEAEESPQQIEAAIWAQLLQDPFFELRIATTRDGGGAASAADPLPGQTWPAQDAIAMLGQMPASLPNISNTGITDVELKAAADHIAASQTLADAANSFEQAVDPEFVTALARAVVAFVLSKHRFDPLGTGPVVLYNEAKRDWLIQEVAKALSPATPKGFGGWVWEKVKEITKAHATSVVRERRTGLTGVSLPGVGDILFYQRRGTDILERIAKDLAACEPPILAVGHSLGGIMLVDLLSRPHAPTIDMLVTVGSQSPLFFIIDALETLRPLDKRIPFTPWLNIYDRNDFLSFCAERVFAKQDNIYDCEVQSGVPFPEAHSAYWHQDEVYRVIKQHWC